MKEFRFIFTALLLSLSFFASAQSRVIKFENPKVTVFLPPKGMENGKAVVACPGGGYSHLSQNHEGFYWSPYFNNLGYALALVEYKLPNGDRNIPLQDVRDTFKILTDSAANWKISPDKIGIMGFSAGGHLASSISTHPTPTCKPAFQILLYPVISLEKELTHLGTRKGFLGENPSDELVKEWSAYNKVSPDTPPAFIALTSDDKAVKPMNSILYYNALQENEVPVEMIIFPSGGHGWGHKNNFKHLRLLLEQLTDWLNIYVQ